MWVCFPLTKNKEKIAMTVTKKTPTRRLDSTYMHLYADRFLNVQSVCQLPSSECHLQVRVPYQCYIPVQKNCVLDRPKMV